MLEQLLAEVVLYARDQIAVLNLRREIDRLKLRNYDLMADTVRGLRRALETRKRAMEDLTRQIEERDAQIAKLREEYAALQARQAHEGIASVRDERLAIFRRIQPIATQLPTLTAALDLGADIAARDVLDLFRPLDETLQDLGFERIGEAGDEVAFDPKRHRPAGRGARGIAPGDPVRVRYVGYLYDGEVVCKAEVTQRQIVATLSSIRTDSVDRPVS